MRLWALLLLAHVVSCSEGDHLSEFKDCLQRCNSILDCAHVNIFEQIQSDQELMEQNEVVAPKPEPPPERPPVDDDEDEELVPRARLARKYVEPVVSYDERDFKRFGQFWLTRKLFFWDCKLECNYKCVRLVTEAREKAGLPMVQFYGKWPFVRVFGITELMLVIFSLANLHAHRRNLYKVLNQYNKNRRNHSDASVIHQQFLFLIIGSLIGWLFSAIFHTRDTPFTETLDYLGAFLISLLNFNAIFVRFFRLFKAEHKTKRQIFQLLLAFTFIGHSIRLKINWDYSYNLKINIFFGILALILWVLHSFETNKLYNTSLSLPNNSTQLSPFEGRILKKLNYIVTLDSSYIPFAPIFLNLWLLVGLSFELLDFYPIKKLLDAHAIWHFFTIWPPFIWYDWNIWDVELYRLNLDAYKLT